MGHHRNLAARRMVLLAPFVMALTLTGCVGNTSGQLTLTRDQAQAATYYVQRHDRDTRDLASTIAKRMQVRGLVATSGAVASRPADVDYLVTYVDKWMWDMRMYLFDLRIDVRDARDESIVGFGESMQSSLKAMGKTHEDIVDQALNRLFPSDQ